MRDFYLYLKNINIIVTDGGYFSPDEGVAWQLHTHTAGITKLYYIKEGACLITIEGHTYEGRAGAFFFIPARVRHSYCIKERPFSKYWMHLSSGPEGEPFPGTPEGYLAYPDTRALDAAFSRFCSMLGGDTVADLFGVRASAFEILSLYWRAVASGEGKEIGSAGRLGAVLRAMENRLSAPLSNTELAEVAHMHPTNFVRYFKAQIGATPKAYVQRLRMERAGELLRKSSLYISEIAERLGYYDGMYFSKVFKKYHSLTPSEYRCRYGEKE